MSKVRVLSLTRAQLARFIPDPESIKEFEKLFSQNSDVVIVVNNIISGAGLAADGSYPGRSGTNYLDSSNSLFKDGSLLDSALLELVTKVSSSTPLSSTSQTVLADASLGIINLTLPNPIEFFNQADGRSFRMAIHKIDSSTNAVNILPFSGELVVNEASQSLLYEGEILNFITDGINWYLGA